MSAVDRLDILAATYYGDSQLWWRIADANAVSDPDELSEPGRRLRITHPQGSGGVAL
jgi:nucleoid-associated protein YgaU